MAAAQKKRRRRKPETSKVVLVSVLCVCCALEIAVLLGWLVWDRTDAAGLAGVFSAPAVAVISWYTWKAKCENIQKYGYKARSDDNEEDMYAG